jgi:hypothetical protein
VAEKTGHEKESKKREWYGLSSITLQSILSTTQHEMKHLIKHNTK